MSKIIENYNEDIPRNTKATVKRLLDRLARQRKKLAAVACATLISTASYAAIPLVIGLGIDRLVAAIQSYDPDVGIIQTAVAALGLPVLLMLAAAGISGLLSYVEQQMIADVGEKLSLSFRQDVSAKLNRLPLRYFDTHKTGEVMSRITNDLEKVSAVIQVGLMQLITSIFTIVFTCMAMLLINPVLFLIVLASIIASIVATKYVSALSQRYYGKNMEVMGRLSGKIEEVFSGNRIIKLFHQEETMIDAVNKLNQEQFEANRKAQFADFAIYPAIRILGQLGFVAAATVGGGMALSGILTLGAVQAFLQYVNQIIEPITQTSYVITSLQAAIAGSERVFTLLDEKEETLDESQREVLVPEGRVTFENVEFGYSKERILMKQVNLEVKPSEMVAIVGPTGGGKTTLVNLLMRFYEISKGSISIDGMDISDMSRGAMRRKIGMVLQDAWLFEGSIAENIAYGRMDASREEVVAAAKAASCDHFIRTLPKGYDTIISGEAAEISQGQMQLLTIARAMLTDPAILILDEATSSVDTRTEVEIQKAMARLMRGKTSFVIAHRLSTIKGADMILVVNEGDIVERGSHEELLRKNGFYASLYQSQLMAG